MAIKIDFSAIPAGMTKRELAKACGFSVGAKGRFKPDVLEVLSLAEANGYVFDTPAAAAKSEAPRIDTSNMDLDAFREWAGQQGYVVADRGRIKNDYLIEYVAAVPDFPKRKAVEPKETRVKSEKVEIKPLPDYDAKAARAWAIDNGHEVPERGRLPRWIAELFIKSHEDAGIEIPKSEPEANNFGPTMPRINHEDWWEGIDLDGKKIRKSFKDVSANGSMSIGWQPRPVFAWSQFDTDEMIELTPVS